MVLVSLTPLARSLEPRCRWALQTFTALTQTGLGAEGVVQIKQLLERLTETFRAEEQRRRQTRKNSVEQTAASQSFQRARACKKAET